MKSNQERPKRLMNLRFSITLLRDFRRRDSTVSKSIISIANTLRRWLSSQVSFSSASGLICGAKNSLTKIITITYAMYREVSLKPRDRSASNSTRKILPSMLPLLLLKLRTSLIDIYPLNHLVQWRDQELWDKTRFLNNWLLIINDETLLNLFDL